MNNALLISLILIFSVSFVSVFLMVFRSIENDHTSKRLILSSTPRRAFAFLVMLMGVVLAIFHSTKYPEISGELESAWLSIWPSLLTLLLSGLLIFKDSKYCWWVYGASIAVFSASNLYILARGGEFVGHWPLLEVLAAFTLLFFTAGFGVYNMILHSKDSAQT